MPKKSDLPLEFVGLRLVAGDKATLQEFYPTIGYNAAVRQIVHNHTKKLRERAAREGAQSNAAIRALASELAAGDDGDGRD